MGSHQRYEIKVTEKIVSKLLNNKSITDEKIEEGLFEVAEETKDRINEDFPSLRQCVHLGNSYDSIGDIRLDLDNGEQVYCELKMTSGSRGTLANLNGDALTRWDLFTNIESWSEFRKKKSHTKWVMEELNKFSYPTEIENIDPELKKRRKKMAKHLKNVIECGRRNTETVADEILQDTEEHTEEQIKAANIIKNIIEKDKLEKSEYISHLQDSKQNKANIKKFTLLMKSGFHTTELLEEKWDIPVETMEKEFSNRYIIYIVDKNDYTIEMEDRSETLQTLRDKELTFNFPENAETSLKIGYYEDGSFFTVLSISFHWGNKFQGIQTPCLKIFD